MATFFSTLFGPWGLFFVLLGVLVPLLSPVIPALTGRGHALTTLHLWLAMKLHGRLAWVVDAQDRLVPKKLHRQPETGNDYVKLDGETLTFEDPDLSVSRWMNVDMTLADGKYGVLFDPRHAVLGGRILDLRDRDEAVIAASSSRATDDHSISRWVRGVIAFPDGRLEVPRLSWVRQLFGGREKAAHPDILKEFYKKSREPYQDGGGEWVRLATLIAAIILPALAMWLVGDYIGGPGGATGGGGGGGGGGPNNNNSTNLGIVTLLALGSLSALPWRDYARRAGRILLLVIIWGSAIGLFITAHWLSVAAVGIGPTLAADLAFIAGVLLFGFVLLLGAASSIVGGGVASLLFRLGLFAYRQPVFVWTRDGYSLVDWPRLDDSRKDDRAKPVWYRAFGSDIGFSFKSESESWGETIPHADLRTMTTTSGSVGVGDLPGDASSGALADGGTGAIADTNLPAGYVGVPELRRAGGYAGYVPKNLNDNEYYIHSGVALNRLWTAATGEKSLAALLAAKEEYGGDTSLDEFYWMAATAGLALVSFVGGAILFVL